MLILKPALFNTPYLFYVIRLELTGYCYLKGRSDTKSPFISSKGLPHYFSNQLGVTQESTNLLLLIIKTVILRVFVLYINMEINHRFLAKILHYVMERFLKIMGDQMNMIIT